MLEDRPSAKLGTSDYFFIEADEYDSAYFQKISKFHFYSINHLILTSLEFDHADIFDNLKAIEEQFDRLISTVSNSFIFSNDYNASTNLYNKHLQPAKSWTLYGEHSQVGPKKIRLGAHFSYFTLNYKGEELEFKAKVNGRQNILNLSAAILFSLNEGFPFEDIQKAIIDLKQVKRRQEIKGHYKGALVIDDFAHHPTAVALTLEGIKKRFADKKILTIFAPSSATARSSLLQDKFCISLLSSDDIVLVTPNRPSNIKNHGDIDCQKMAQEIKKSKEDQNSTISWVTNLSDLKKEIENIVYKRNKENVVILILSNGNVLGLLEEI